jgi:hypothetical protein
MCEGECFEEVQYEEVYFWRKIQNCPCVLQKCGNNICGCVIPLWLITCQDGLCYNCSLGISPGDEEYLKKDIDISDILNSLSLS